MKSNADNKIDPRFDQIKTVEKSIEKLENSFNSYKPVTSEHNGTQTPVSEVKVELIQNKKSTN